MEAHSVYVIICSKNNGITIRRCIESVLAQDYPIAEILVVDGRSIDGTMQILSSYPSIKIESDEGKGLAHARYLGWKCAKGQFVAYIDADSEIPSFWLREMMTEMEKDNHLAGVQDSQISISLSNSLMSFLNVCFFTVSAYRAQKGAMGGMENSIWSRKALEDVSGFDEFYRMYFEDVDLIARIHLMGARTLRVERIKHKHFVRQTPRESFLQHYWRGYFARVFDERHRKVVSIPSILLPSIPSAILHSIPKMSDHS